ncbi:hypothetical protein DNTS_032871 [Danionella cerebrum]|uniref:Protein kinase domain-containing protein n=1 Tax=Danionella cerebrum TaxID=2873325 RepID=A0A553QTT3_9TELE|nr:hypothetical protein DNTS_032871 [Danionella translucida]
MAASTANYIWYTEDVIGQGATSTIYRARNKKTSEEVAVKVFNLMSQNRPFDIQKREFEVLQRLNHVNIVQLFAVEETMTNQQKVLVMELCSGGSLLNQLENFENMFGIPESEFLIVLQCVVHGVNHLREMGIVHRDIKPGNILRRVGEDGRSVYKLTDFGGARELEDDQTFVSIYGTEEYLHPDMYQCAILGKPPQKEYGATVDLWSIGVTLYHTATGRLPFIPYGGPRKNRNLMYKIITEKPEGTISGVQKENEGPIEWGFQLPETCQLSMGLKTLLVPVLSKLMEANQKKSWGFQQFFAATTDILQRITIHIFSLQQATEHCIHTHFHNTVSVLLEDVQAQTGIQPAAQRFFFQGHPIILEASLKVVNLPPTRSDQPLILISRRQEKAVAQPYKEPETPAVPPKFDIMADQKFSRALVGAIYRYLRVAQSLRRFRELILQGFYTYIENIRNKCVNMAQKVAVVEMKLITFLNMEKNLHQFTQTFAHEFPEFIESQKSLPLIEVDLQQIYSGGIREFINHLHYMHGMLSKHTETLAQDRSIQKMEELLLKILAGHEQYCFDRQAGSLSYNNEQIHKFEKLQLRLHVKKVKALLKDECWKKYQDVLMDAKNWGRVLYEIQMHIESFYGLLQQRIEDLNAFEDQQRKVGFLLTLVVDKAVARALQQPKEPETEAENQKNERMILKMTKLKNEMEILACELQNNNSMIESLPVVTAALPVDKKVHQPNML